MPAIAMLGRAALRFWRRRIGVAVGLAARCRCIAALTAAELIFVAHIVGWTRTVLAATYGAVRHRAVKATTCE